MNRFLPAVLALATGLAPCQSGPSDFLPPDVAARAALGPTQVVFDRPDPAGPLWACGRAWKASFDATGATVVPFFGSDAPRNFPLRVEVEAARVAGEALALQPGEPARHGGEVRTKRGAMTEVWATSLEQLEQSFVFEQLPARGAIEVDVRMVGEFTAAPIEGGLRFANDWGRFDYTKAVAVDARGQRRELAIEWTGASARLTIPADFVATAELPLVLDPVLNAWWALGNPALLQRKGDVATMERPTPAGRMLLIWQRQWSATDMDCWGLMFDRVLGLVQTDFAIDFTTADWVKVAVASNNYAQNFLVVAEVRVPVFLANRHDIVGRTIAANVTQGAVFNIEVDGVVGLPGSNFHPDVGGDPYFGPGRYTVVFHKRNGFANDIYMKQVRPDGTLVTTNPIAIDTSSNDESRPSISKSCGPSNGLPAFFLVTYQRTYPFAPFDQDVRGRFVVWSGAAQGTDFSIAGAAAEETAPSAGSPFDSGGVRYWPVVHERATAVGQPRDVLARVFDSNGAQVVGPYTVNSSAPSHDEREPEIDSDGTRFVVTYTHGTAGYPFGVEAVTLAYVPTTNTLRVEERTGLNTSGLDDNGQTNVVAAWSGGNSPTPDYYICFTHYPSNTLELRRYGGHRSGNQFATRYMQCGSLSTISASGSSVLGQTLTISATGPAAGIVVGTPLYVWLQPIFGCGCYGGVDIISFFGPVFTLTIPNDVTLVGAVLSAQGLTAGGSACLGALDFSDTIDFTIR
jgi:hypothetical protein